MSILTSMDQFWKALISAEGDFFRNPMNFSGYEQNVLDLTNVLARNILKDSIEELDQHISNGLMRKMHYNIQRHEDRTLITGAGSITFKQTIYKNRENGKYLSLVENLLNLDKHERFTETAEARIITEAIKTSYSNASKVIPDESEITKTTVMNKVHALTEDMPLNEQTEKKKCSFLYIDADEDHIAEQHGRQTKAEETHGYMGKLAYLYEGKSETQVGRRELINTFYLGGLYSGSNGNEAFWKHMEKYIESNYELSSIGRIYILGDGANWIKTGADYIYKAKFCIDKFHLTEKIHRACLQMLDEKDVAKAEIYRMLYKGKKEELEAYMTSMRESANNADPIEACKTYILNNWDAVMTTLHDKNVLGCSAESHVSHVLSDRMSSRPMGWGSTGSDAMCKLRCYAKNYGEAKIIDLVKLRREKSRLKRTGTDNVEIPEETVRVSTKQKYDQAKSYIDRIQATVPGITSKKIFSIREQIKLI